MDLTNVTTTITRVFPDQKPGTSGLRKRVRVFQQPHYVENFIQAILEAAEKPKFLVVGGDGRFYSEEVIARLENVCAANGVERLVIGEGGILSTPAASALIRHLKADGGIILTASHNPGGPEADFGIKYNISNGGPAPESVTNKIYDISKQLVSYYTLAQQIEVSLDELGAHPMHNGKCLVQVVDPVENYLDMMRHVFDFDLIKRLFQSHSHFRMLADPMNGVVGPYAKRILVNELGAPATSLINATPLEDFGGKHPDPNLTYAKDLVERVQADPAIKFGVAFDGDGDRNMILGEGALFVSPGDSLAILAANMDKIKYFKEREVLGVARSFPTSPAVDRVAKELGLKCYVTPTGWKYFGNLMDAGLISLCGEESFGTGSDHIREKDGLWACLAWLSIMAATGKSVKQLCQDHWLRFGRDYFNRYDYEECDSQQCEAMIKELELVLGVKTSDKHPSLVGKQFGHYTVSETGSFEYTDPVDKSTSSNQGYYVMFEGGARIVVRLSGTGSSGATVRLYLSDYSHKVDEDPQEHLKGLLEAAYQITKLPTYTGRDKPTVVT